MREHHEVREEINVIKGMMKEGQVYEPTQLLKKIVREYGGVEATDPNAYDALMLLSACYEAVHEYDRAFLCLRLVPIGYMSHDTHERFDRIAPKGFSI